MGGRSGRLADTVAPAEKTTLHSFIYSRQEIAPEDIEEPRRIYNRGQQSSVDQLNSFLRGEMYAVET